MKVVFGKRLEVLKEGRLVKVVVNKLREDGGIGRWEEGEVLRSKYEPGNEDGSVLAGRKRLGCKMRRTRWKT